MMILIEQEKFAIQILCCDIVYITMKKQRKDGR